MGSIIKFRGILSGFHSRQPEPEVPELLHAGEEWAPPDYRIPEHEHDFWEFYLQIEGETTWRWNGTGHRVPAGSLLSVSPGQRHALIDRGPGPHHYCFAGLDLTMLAGRQSEIAAVFSTAGIFLHSHTGALGEVFRPLIGEVAESRPFRAAALRLSVDRLALELARVWQGNPCRSLVAQHPGVGRVRQALDENPFGSWTSAELAAFAGLSVSRLNECFRRDTGTSPRQYVLERRLERAAQMLRASDTAVTDLALESGFSSSQHFARAFRSRFQVSPSAYRHQFRADGRESKG